MKEKSLLISSVGNSSLIRQTLVEQKAESDRISDLCAKLEEPAVF